MTDTGAVGVVGLGIMGSGMAANLLAAGLPLHVYNRTAAKAEALAAAGAVVASSPRAVAQACDVVLVCVSDTPDVESVLFGPDGVAAGAASGALVIDARTIAPAATRDFAARLATQGVALVDAPVSGGSEGAKNGTLSIMVGGTAEDVERRPPRAGGDRQDHHARGAGRGRPDLQAGEPGPGRGQHAGRLRGAAAGRRPAGSTRRRPSQAVQGGAGGSWMLANRGPQVVAQDWRPGFTIDLQQKDLRLVLDAADELGVPLLGTAMVFQLYRTLQARGLGGEGNHALAKAVQTLAGRA